MHRVPACLTVAGTPCAKQQKLKVNTATSFVSNCFLSDSARICCLRHQLPYIADAYHICVSVAAALVSCCITTGYFKDGKVRGLDALSLKEGGRVRRGRH